VNAVVAGKYLAATFVDPWSALGFLADPEYAARGGNPELEAFFTGPVAPEVAGITTSAAEPAAATAAPADAADDQYDDENGDREPSGDGGASSA